MTEPETPTEEWQTNARGRQYAVIRGPGGGTVFRKGEESVDEARARRAVEQEAKRRQQAEAPGAAPKAERPRGKGRRPDPKPASSRPSAQGKPKPSREQLAAAAEVPLQALGAFIGRAMLECDFCTRAMVANSGAAAADLAKSTNPYMVSLLTWWWGLLHNFAGGEGLVRYAAPPLVHHALPAPMASFISPLLGVPPRQEGQPGHRHGRTPPARAETQGPTPGEGSPPPPGTSPAPGGNGAAPVMTPEQAAAMAAAGARPPTPEEVQAMGAEAQALRQEAIRLRAAQDLGRRQAAAAQAMAHGPNIPPYRADQAPVQAPPAQPQAAPGTPPAPPLPEGADPAGSPLPPEAMM